MTEALVMTAGAVQLAIATASLGIPRVLGWKEQLQQLEPFTAKVFWTYAAYILGTNLFFAGLSLLAPALLTDGSALARVLAGFIALYWGARALLQVTAYRRYRPQGLWFGVAEYVFLAAFAFCTLVYAGLAWG